MFKNPEFYGRTTVGSRGQIVLPVDLRKECNINPGDKLMVLKVPDPITNGEGQVLLMKAENFTKMFEMFEEGYLSIKEMVKKQRK